MAIACRDFELQWNELLDGCRAPDKSRFDRGSSATERVLMDHAARCAACRLKAAKYEALRSAILACGPPPPVPAGLADRILSELKAPTNSAWPAYATARRPARWTPARRWIAVASFAALVVIGVVLDRMMPTGQPIVLHPAPVEERRDRRVEPGTGPVDYRALNTALADATEATLDLARAASEPAARIGRQVIDAAARHEPGATEVAPAAGPDSIAMTMPVPSLDALAPDPAAAAAVWQQVGDGLASGVRPLTSTARHAFGFLMGPAQVKPELRTRPSAEKGA
jgi:hypothetical protein